MFKNNQYTEEYYSIINYYKNKNIVGYKERHHIIPKSLGGNNKKENIVCLPAKEHFKCHQLLINMVDGENLSKMWSALWRMMNKQSKNQLRNYTFTADDYERARYEHAKSHSKKISGTKNYFYNKKHTQENLLKMTAAKKGKSWDEIYGKEYAAIKRQKTSQISKMKKGIKQSKTTCPHCGSIGGKGIMQRWHFDNCKNRSTSYSSDIEIV